LPLVLVFLLLGIHSSAALADQLRGRIEETHNLEWLPYLQPGVRFGMFSGYDRTGGNNDGFSGDFSIVRLENGKSVIAEMKGPGAITRMYFAPFDKKIRYPFERADVNIEIYFDGNDEPEVKLPLYELLMGEFSRFPRPLVGGGLGGYFCYVPIPYRNGCKVVVDSKLVKFFQISYVEFPSNENISTFSMKLSDQERGSLEQAVQAWSAVGELPVADSKRQVEVERALDIPSGGKAAIELPNGPRVVRAVYLQIGEGFRQAASEVEIAYRWDEGELPAVRVPLEYFFCQGNGPGSFRSLLAGVGEMGWYNFMPMPYRRSARIEFEAKSHFRGAIRIVTLPLEDWPRNLAYLHARYNEDLPTRTGEYHEYLDCVGEGRYLGTFLATDGPPPMPAWFEGDERFYVDGGLASHGTGTEEYFNVGWYGEPALQPGAATPDILSQPGSWTLSGVTVFDRREDRLFTGAYRWHVADAIPFRQDFRALMEHGALNATNANYRSIAFFYYQAPSFPQVETGDVLTNSIGMKLRLIPAGSFTMGSENGNMNESPAHQVTLSKPYYIGVYEVTQEQYQRVMGTNPAKFRGPGRPVENISWEDAESFCKKLSDSEPGSTYRLPAEAEWEYAFRAGSEGKYPWGDVFDPRFCRFQENSRGTTHDAGSRLPNRWGLYDMCGNVYEWCSDWFGRYTGEPKVDPEGETARPKARVLKGGAWNTHPHNLRPSARTQQDPTEKFLVGFRGVREAER
jgi:formylglycine-generating enzyme required for sulfatase activity